MVCGLAFFYLLQLTTFLQFAVNVICIRQVTNFINKNLKIYLTTLPFNFINMINFPTKSICLIFNNLWQTFYKLHLIKCMVRFRFNVYYNL